MTHISNRFSKFKDKVYKQRKKRFLQFMMFMKGQEAIFVFRQPVRAHMSFRNVVNDILEHKA